MMRKLFVGVLLLIAAFIPRAASSQNEPVVRIGLNQNATSVTLRSSALFKIQQHGTRSAKFSTVLTVEPTDLNRILRKDQLHYRMVIELDGGQLVVLPMSNK